MTSPLQIDFSAAGRPLKRVWEFGFNTDHAPMVMRADVQAHIKRAHDELGMNFWRCHGTLSDDVGIVTQGPDGARRFAFSGLKRIVDAGLKCGVLPFFELSFMPSALARDPKRTIAHYRGITSPPNSFEAWGELIAQTTRFLAETYGIEALRSWYFEVWNEPNIPFWSGTQAEYFELYRHAALALKSVDDGLRVGGPATARAAWVPQFLRFCHDTRTPVDFVATHVYPSDLEFLDAAHGEVELLGPQVLFEAFRQVRREVAASSFPNVPIIWGEWNSSAGPLALNHDECNNAALICAALSGIEEYGDGSLFWNLSDIYEEAGFHFEPFHGGYGLYSVDDIAKSSARAFELCKRLGQCRLEIEGTPANIAQGALATRDANAVLLWNHTLEANGAAWPISLRAQGIEAQTATMTLIAPRAGSAYESWRDMGSPATLSPAQHALLTQASQPLVAQVPRRDDQFEITLDAGCVALLEF